MQGKTMPPNLCGTCTGFPGREDAGLHQKAVKANASRGSTERAAPRGAVCGALRCLQSLYW